MIKRWYRAYEGTVQNPKLHEVALIAKTSRSVVIAVWHALLESCTHQQSSKFETTPRRIAVTLSEEIATIEAVFNGLQELKLISSEEVLAWSEKQFQSDSSAERTRSYRDRKRHGDVNHPSQERHVTPSDTDTDTDTDTEEEPPVVPQGDEQTGSENLPSQPKRFKHGRHTIEAFFQTWNNRGLPECRLLLENVPNIGELMQAVSFYNSAEIYQGIENYATILKGGSKYRLNFHYATVVNFLIKGLPLFVDSGKPFEMYAIRAAPEPAAKAENDASWADDAVKGVV